MFAICVLSNIFYWEKRKKITNNSKINMLNEIIHISLLYATYEEYSGWLIKGDNLSRGAAFIFSWQT